MAYIIEEFFGDSYVKIAVADTQAEALSKMQTIHESNLLHKRQSGVRVVNDGIIVDSVEFEGRADELQE